MADLVGDHLPRPHVVFARMLTDRVTEDLGARGDSKRGHELDVAPPMRVESFVAKTLEVRRRQRVGDGTDQRVVQGLTPLSGHRPQVGDRALARVRVVEDERLRFDRRVRVEDAVVVRDRECVPAKKRGVVGAVVVSGTADEQNRLEAVAGSLLGRLCSELRVRAQIGDAVTERAATILGEQLAYERLPRPGRQFDGDIPHIVRLRGVFAQQISLMRPQMPNAAIARAQGAEERLGGLDGGRRITAGDELAHGDQGIAVVEDSRAGGESRRLTRRGPRASSRRTVRDLPPGYPNSRPIRTTSIDVA